MTQNEGRVQNANAYGNGYDEVRMCGGGDSDVRLARTAFAQVSMLTRQCHMAKPCIITMALVHATYH